MMLKRIFIYITDRKKTPNQPPPFNELNRAALHALRALGFSLPVIRKALVDLNQIKLREIAPEEIAPSCLSMTLRGYRDDQRAQTMIAQKLGLEIEELWPQP